jgi:hypothetical protein
MPNGVNNRIGRPHPMNPMQLIDIMTSERDHSWFNKQDNISDYVKTLITKDRMDKTGK